MELDFEKEFVLKNDSDKVSNVKFLRVKIKDLKNIVDEIISNLYNVSWLNQLSNEELKIGFLACAEPTIKKICDKLNELSEQNDISEIGEYVVSNVARLIIEETYDYYVLPLAELLKEKVSNNSGFDYHCENKEDIPIFGEAKYVAGKNGYGRALSQVVDFINDNKDKKEIPFLSHFFKQNTIKNLVLQNKGYSISFSTTNISTENLLDNIIKNEDFKKLIGYNEIIVVAVDI